MTKQNDISEARTENRFVLTSQLDALFGTTEIEFVDIGEHGAQIQHTTPLKLGTEARLSFTVPSTGQQTRIAALVVWCRISAKPDQGGRHNYRSGIRIHDDAGVMKAALEQLQESSLVRRDALSMEKKLKVQIEKERARQQPGAKLIGRGAPRIPGDVILLIKQTRLRLQAHPDEAVKWYNRAKYSLDEAGVQIHHRDEILAIWEYLERSVELNIITRVIDEMGK